MTGCPTVIVVGRTVFRGVVGGWSGIALDRLVMMVGMKSSIAVTPMQLPGVLLLSQGLGGSRGPGLAWRLVLLPVIAAVLLVSSGCGLRTRTVEESDLVGTWRGNDGATLTLSTDGTFQAEQFPLQLAAPDFFTTPHTGSGVSELLPSDKYEGQRIELVVDHKALDTIEPEWSGGHVRLFFFIGDPDEDRRYWLCRKNTGSTCR